MRLHSGISRYVHRSCKACSDRLELHEPVWKWLNQSQSMLCMMDLREWPRMREHEYFRAKRYLRG